MDTSKLLKDMEQHAVQSRKGPFPFFRQVIGMIAVVSLTALSAIYLNGEDLRSRLSDSRFAELQIFSEHLNAFFNTQENELRLLSRYSLLAEQLKQDNWDPKQTQSYLSRLQRYHPQIAKILLVDSEGQPLISSGEQLSLPDADIPIQLAQLEQDQFWASQMRSRDDLTYRWMLIQATPNLHNVAGVLVAFKLAPVWTRFDTFDSPERPDIYLIDADGEPLSHQQASDCVCQKLLTKYPKLWQKMQQDEFGRWNTNRYHFIYLKVETSASKPLYLMTVLDDLNPYPLQKRYEQQVGVGALILILVLSGLLWHRKDQQNQSRARYRAERLLDQLYQGELSMLLFDQAGHCVSANLTATTQIDIEQETLQHRRFSHLFENSELGIENVWRMARRAGQWQGQLELRSPNPLSFDATLKLLPLSHHEELLLVSFDQSPRQQSLQHRLSHLERVCEGASGLALLDSENTIIEANPSLVQILELDRKQLIGSNWLDHSALESTERNQWTSLNENLSSKQGLLWFRRGDRSMVQCLVNMQKGRSQEEASDHVLTLTPVREQWILRELSGKDSGYPIKPLESELHKHNEPICLLLLQLTPESGTSGFDDSETLQYRRQKMLKLLEGALPQESIIGEDAKPDEITILLPGWEVEQATLLTDGLAERLNVAGIGEGLAIGVARHLTGQSWPSFRNQAREGAKRARQSNQPYCQAHTRAVPPSSES